MAPAPAIAVVSHSAALASGIRELCAQMAPDIVVRPIGGLEDGSLGTDLTRLQAEVESLLGEGRSVLITADIGSAVMTAEIVAEVFADAPGGCEVRALDCPVVHGTLAAAVRARSGGTLDECAEAALETAADWEEAIGGAEEPSEPAQSEQGGADPAVAAGGADGIEGLRTTAATRVTIADPMGIHTRPAAEILATVDAAHGVLAVNGRECRTLVEVLSMRTRDYCDIAVTVDGEGAVGLLRTVLGVLSLDWSRGA